MSGVGTELSKMIPDWAVEDKKGCSCKSMAAKWDKYGIAWCERNANLIVGHLLGESGRLIPFLRAVPEPIKRAATLRMLGKAIRNAKKASQA